MRLAAVWPWANKITSLNLTRWVSKLPVWISAWHSCWRYEAMICESLSLKEALSICLFFFLQGPPWTECQRDTRLRKELENWQKQAKSLSSFSSHSACALGFMHTSSFNSHSNPWRLHSERLSNWDSLFNCICSQTHPPGRWGAAPKKHLPGSCVDIPTVAEFQRLMVPPLAPGTPGDLTGGSDTPAICLNSPDTTRSQLRAFPYVPFLVFTFFI